MTVATPAEELVHHDLEFITARLQREFQAMAGGRVLIAGGAGFLGYYLVQAPLHWNRLHSTHLPIQVTVLDSFVRGVPEWLETLTGDPHVEVLTHDVTQPLPAALGDAAYIIHAASIASPSFYRRRPIETMDANVHGLRHLLEYCSARAATGGAVRGMLFFSSSEIYGDPTPEHIPTPETYRGFVSCTGPRACYDESKRYGETLCVNFAEQRGVPVTTARPFNNYGPGLKITDRRVIPDFARDILEARDVALLSDGSPSRTFCYVADAVVGYYKILVRGAPGEAYNIGVEAPEVSVVSLAEEMVSLARELFAYKGRVVRRQSDDRDYLIDNPERRCPVILKARRELAYEPEIPLREGLRRTLLWYREHQKATDA